MPLVVKRKRIAVALRIYFVRVLRVQVFYHVTPIPRESMACPHSAVAVKLRVYR